MPTWHRVTCVTLATDPAAADPHTRITHLCGSGINGKPWRLTVREVMDGMRSGKWGFFVVIGGQRHDLILAADPAGVRYVKTRLDPDGPASLLALPEYPASP